MADSLVDMCEGNLGESLSIMTTLSDTSKTTYVDLLYGSIFDKRREKLNVFNATNFWLTMVEQHQFYYYI